MIIYLQACEKQKVGVNYLIPMQIFFILDENDIIFEQTKIHLKQTPLQRILATGLFLKRDEFLFDILVCYLTFVHNCICICLVFVSLMLEHSCVVPNKVLALDI
jgi:hypothetical protein